MDQLPITSDQLALYTKIQLVSLGQDASPSQGYPPPPNLAESQTLTSLCRVQLTYHQGTSSPTH